MMDLYGNGLLLGEKTLDSLWMRQNLTMNNIANVLIRQALSHNI